MPSTTAPTLVIFTINHLSNQPIVESEVAADDPGSTSATNYRARFETLFGIGILLSLAAPFEQNPTLAIATIAALVLLTFAWCYNFNTAWKLIGKRYGWAVGLVAIIPFAPLIMLGIAYYYLKATPYWRGTHKSFRLTR